MTEQIKDDQSEIDQPSQAEGERDSVEQDLGRQRRTRQPTPDTNSRPSQAEGERDTIEQDLGEKKRTSGPQ